MKNFEKMAADLYSFAKESSKTNNQHEQRLWLKMHEDDAIQMLFSGYSRTSRRTKLLVYAIAAGLSREETDALLLEYRRESLYVRNIADILIMRALDKEYTVNQLCELVDRVRTYTDEIPEYSAMNGKELTIKSMKDYLDYCQIHLKNAEDSSSLTSELQNLYDLSISLEDDGFIDMIRDNTVYFSKLRERTRQEYIRYLYKYAKHVVEVGDNDAIIELFQNSTGKKTSRTEENSLIDEQTSTHTRQVRLPPEEWPIKILDLGYDINEFYMGGLYNVNEYEYSRKDHRDFEPQARKEDKQRWLEQNSSPEDEDQQKQKERYDAIIRNFLRGKSDISRTLFLSNILFFDCKTNGTIQLQPLNDVLSRCGWNEIDYTGEYGFDRMIVDLIDYYNEKDITFLDHVYMILEDLKDPVFAEYHEKFQDHQGKQPINEATYNFLQSKGEKNVGKSSAETGTVE